MNLTAYDLAMSLLAIVTLGGLAVSLAAHGMGRGHALGRRFRFALCVTALLFAARAGTLAAGWGGFATLSRLCAALIPLCVILVTEGLLRRHAPAWVKLWCLFGTPAALLVALWPSPQGVDLEDILLLVWQVAGFVSAASLILGRDRASLSGAENRVIDRLSLSLGLLCLVALVDFLGPALGLRIRLGGAGVILLCWLAVNAGQLRWGDTVIAATTGAGLALCLPPLGAIDAFVLFLSCLTALIAMRAGDQWQQHHAPSGLPDVARHPLAAEQIRRHLRDHPLLQGAVTVQAADLEDSDPLHLGAIGRNFPLVSPEHPALSRAQADEVALLCNRMGATHLIVAAWDPLDIRALALPQLAMTPALEGELALLAKLSQLEGAHDHAR